MSHKKDGKWLLVDKAVAALSGYTTLSVSFERRKTKPKRTVLLELLAQPHFDTGSIQLRWNSKGGIVEVYGISFLLKKLHFELYPNFNWWSMEILDIEPIESLTEEGKKECMASLNLAMQPIFPHRACPDCGRSASGSCLCGSDEHIIRIA